jgi:hypothetical protein
MDFSSRPGRRHETPDSNKGEEMFRKDTVTVPKDKAAERNFIHGFKIFEIIFIILMVLSLIGVGVTDFSPSHSYWYWFAMAPTFACAFLIIEWTRVRSEAKSWVNILKTQLLTWLGLLFAVQVVYLLLRAGRLTYESTGLVILLLLALTTFVAGIQLGFLLCLLGGFLGLTVLMVAYLEQYVWVLVFLAVTFAVVSFYVLRRKLRQ